MRALRQLLLFNFLIIRYFEGSEALRVDADIAEAIGLRRRLWVLYSYLGHASAAPHELICFGMHSLEVHLLYFERIGLHSVHVLVKVACELFHVYHVRARILLGLIVPSVKVVGQILKSHQYLVLIYWEQSIGAAFRCEVALQYVEQAFRRSSRVVASDLGKLLIYVKVESKEVLRPLLDS